MLGRSCVSHWFCGGSTFNKLREDEQRIVVVFTVVFVVVVGVSRVRCLLVCVAGWVIVVVLVEVAGRA